MIRIDKEKCVACGACVRDCIVHVLTGAQTDSRRCVRVTNGTVSTASIVLPSVRMVR